MPPLASTMHTQYGPQSRLPQYQNILCAPLSQYSEAPGVSSDVAATPQHNVQNIAEDASQTFYKSSIIIILVLWEKICIIA